MNDLHFIIFTKDVQLLTGLSLRQAQRILQRIRKKLKKEKDHLVTINEFCNFCQFSVEDVVRILKK